MDGGATALAPSDSQSTSLGLGKSKGSGKKKRLPLRLVRSAVRVCLDTVEFVRDRMTALKLKRETKGFVNIWLAAIPSKRCSPIFPA